MTKDRLFVYRGRLEYFDNRKFYREMPRSFYSRMLTYIDKGRLICFDIEMLRWFNIKMLDYFDKGYINCLQRKGGIF